MRATCTCTWPQRGGGATDTSACPDQRFWNRAEALAETLSTSRSYCRGCRGTATRSRARFAWALTKRRSGSSRPTRPATPDSLRRFSMTERCLDAGATFEDMCVAFELAYAANVDGVLCECCHSRCCEACKHATGWHICDADRAALAAVLQEDQQPERRWQGRHPSRRQTGHSQQPVEPIASSGASGHHQGRLSLRLSATLACVVCPSSASLGL